MNCKTIKLAVVLSVIKMANVQAQSVVPAVGSNAISSGGSVSYSVGQIVYTTNFSSIGSIAQGVQQPYEISILTGIKEAKDILLQCLIYPNPTNDFVRLKIENDKIENLTYQLYDITGKLLENNKVESQEVNIALCNYAATIYCLKVIYNGKELKTFKIIKN